MASPELRFWRTLKYFDAAEALLALQKAEVAMAHEIVEGRVARLRTASLKPFREARDAALFAHGMSAYLGARVLFSPTERDDYDFVTCVEYEGTSYFTPVQLKELVPADLNPGASLEGLLAKLRAKPVYSNTALAIRLNRDMKGFGFSADDFVGLPFREVWLYWASSPDATRWRLVGDCLSLPRSVDYTYPTEGAA